MKSKQIPKAEMLKRVARFTELHSSSRAFVDMLIPGHEREIYNIIGRGVTEDTTLKPAIQEAEGFNMTLNKVGPGKGGALHSHTTVEVFMPLSGKWSVYWGDNGEEEVILDQWDVISVPPGVMRGFRNVGTEDSYLLAVLSGTDAGHVTWDQRVLDRAKETGIGLDTDGNLVRSSG